MGARRCPRCGGRRAAAVAAVITWTVAIARPRADVGLCAAAGGLAVHAYHVPAVSAHEPHLFPAVPLLALAAAGRPRLWLPCAVVSLIAALNLELSYGLGTGARHLTPATIGGVETASVLALANGLALVWHALEALRSDADR